MKKEITQSHYSPFQQANIGIKKQMVHKMMSENRKHPKHNFRHELMQGSSKRYLKGMRHEGEENAWRYARLNPMSDKRMF